MRLELERGYDPKVASPAAHAPEEVRVFSRTGSEYLPISGHDVNGEQAVNRKSIFAHQPAQATTQRQTGQPGSTYSAGGCGETIGQRGLYELTECKASLNLDGLVCWTDAGAFHL